MDDDYYYNYTATKLFIAISISKICPAAEYIFSFTRTRQSKDEAASPFHCCVLIGLVGEAFIVDLCIS